MRVAVYYAPALDDPLWRAGASWLGRDTASGATVPQPELQGITEVTAAPRRYGFHATLKPPMRLAGNWNAFLAGVQTIATSIAPFDLPPLAVADLHGFLALRETAPCPGIRSLADAVVAELDPFRAPPDSAELMRRRNTGLSAQAEAMLARWGYPYVFETWRFHMTLTCRLDPDWHQMFSAAAKNHFAAALSAPRRVQDICIFVQPEPDGAFSIAARIPLTGI